MKSYSTFASLAGALAILIALWTPSLSGCTDENLLSAAPSTDASVGGDGAAVEPEEAAVAQDAASDADASFSEMNPYGFEYPTSFLGTRVRVGAARGSVIANLKFIGYAPNATNANGVQLADVFDPQGRTHDIVALILNGSWDPASQEMMAALRSGIPARVALVSVLGEGSTRGAAATPSELATWRLQSGVPSAWFLLDPAFNQFPVPLFSHETLPALVILDARTMEIVSSGVGLPPQTKTALESFRDETKARAPAY